MDKVKYIAQLNATVVRLRQTMSCDSVIGWLELCLVDREEVIAGLRKQLEKARRGPTYVLRGAESQRLCRLARMQRRRPVDVLEIPLPARRAYYRMHTKRSATAYRLWFRQFLYGGMVRLFERDYPRAVGDTPPPEKAWINKIVVTGDALLCSTCGYAGVEWLQRTAIVSHQPTTHLLCAKCGSRWIVCKDR